MKKNLFIFLFLPVLAWAQQYDVFITNGKVIDGTGNSWFYADVAIKDGKIIAVGKLNQPSAKKIIDAKGLFVAPGFIDVHTHIEGEEAKTPTAENFIYDGVTTVVTGNCGSSQVDMAKYFAFLDSIKLSINIAALIGHNDVRKAVMGRAMRDPSATELQQMIMLVEQAMRNGAVGLSTGLIYIPGTYANTDEIVKLAAAAAKYNGVYASHIRNEGDSVAAAIREAIHIGYINKMPVEISHFKVSGQQNWGRSKETVALIENARKDGVDVTIDQYPYTASSTQLSTMLPDEILADGQDSIVARLTRSDVRSYVIESMLKSLKKRGLKHFSYPVVANYKFDTSLNGKSIEQITLIKGKKHKASAEAETVIEMMINGGAQMVFHGMSEPDVKRIMQYPFNMFASDAGIRAFGSGVPHPRGYGTNARVLAKYVREENVLTLEEAIRRMTSLPAQKFQLNDRGLLKAGMAADIVIFDAATVKDNSTFEQPHQYSTGFFFVLVNGEVVVENAKHTGTRSGRSLKGPGYLQ